MLLWVSESEFFLLKVNQGKGGHDPDEQSTSITVLLICVPIF